MASCDLSTIVTLGLCPDEVEPLSGYRLVDAPEISIKNLNDIANETYMQGVSLAKAKLKLSIIDIKNDFLRVMQENRVITQMTDPSYNTSIRFEPSVNLGTYPGDRGITLRVSRSNRSRLRKTYIEEITVYPLTGGTSTIKIDDGLTIQHFPVTLVANQLNKFEIDYQLINGSARVTLDNTNIEIASAPVYCMEGCDGSMPNDCGFARGWNGTTEIKNEGYGISVKFKCACDYDEILCDMKSSYIGKLIWLRTRFYILQEQLNSNRFSAWVIYGQPKVKELIDAVNAEYNLTWNGMMDGLFNILKNYNDETCLTCRGIRWVTNI
jgi:hypothetical protein